MIRGFRTSDKTWIRARLAESITNFSVQDNRLEKAFTDDNAVAFFKTDNPKAFCCLRYSEVPKGYYPFSGVCTKVSYLLGDFNNVEQVLPILAKSFYEMGKKRPEALSRPTWATLDPQLVQAFKPYFNANLDPKNPRLAWHPTLQQTIDEIARWRI